MYIKHTNMLNVLQTFSSRNYINIIKSSFAHKDNLVFRPFGEVHK
jgi:hypothetical protein